MRVLVLGANGFVGRPLLDRLTRDPNIEVVCTPGSPETYTSSTRIPRCTWLPVHPLRQPRILAERLHDAPPFDVCLDLLTASLPVQLELGCEQNPLPPLHDAIARVAPGLRYVFASSTLVYGDRPNETLREDSERRPVGASARWMAEAEDNLFEGSLCRALRPLVLRLAPTYGGSADERLLRASEGALAVIGDGRARSTFLHVDDLVALLAQVLRRPPRDRLYVASDLEPGTFAEFFQTVAQMGGAPFRTMPVEAALADPPLARFLGLRGARPEIVEDWSIVLAGTRVASPEKLLKEGLITELLHPSYRTGLKASLEDEVFA